MGGKGSHRGLTWRRTWMYTFAAPLDRALHIAADS
jgi:hypothetical protein